MKTGTKNYKKENKFNEPEIKKVFDENFGLLSMQKLYKKLKEIQPEITQKEIKEFHEKQEINQITKSKVKPKQFNTVTANYPGDTYQIDILVYKKYEIHKYKYIIVVQDVYSRYMEALPMTNRENPNIIKKIMSIFEIMGTPYKIQCDNEFNTREFNKLMKELKINVNYSDPDEINKNAIVERSNRTLRSLLEKYRLYNKNNNWYKYLKIIVEVYNDTEHDTIKHKPIDVWEGKYFNEQEVTRFTPDYKVGDIVRKVIKKKIFDKIDELKHTKELYKILEIKKNRYLINDGTDRFHKPYEIVKANTVVYKDPGEVPAIPKPPTKKQYKIPEFEPIKTRSKK